MNIQSNRHRVQNFFFFPGYGFPTAIILKAGFDREYFPQAKQKVVDVVDLNVDGNPDHEEWHEFRETP